MTTALVAAALASQPALAQSQDGATASTATNGQDQDSAANQSDEQSGMGVIVVTAQRREESLQDVPIAVSAFSGETLAERGITNTLELAQSIPNMVANGNTGLGSSNSFYIRGLGNTESIATFDPPVGVYVDDIYLSRQNANNLALFDVDRVEVLRGPQGTLFGRNTTGGAINVVMRRPEFDAIDGYGEVGYGSFHKKVARGSINLPLADTLAVRISGYYQDDDGYARNTKTGERLNDDDGWGARLAIRGELSDSVRWNGAYSYIEANGTNVLNFPCDPYNPSNCKGRFYSSGYRTGRVGDTTNFPMLDISGEKANYLQGNYTQSHIISSNLAIDLSPDVTVSLITGYVRQAQQYGLDFYDGRAAPSMTNPTPAVTGYDTGGFVYVNNGYADQFSQEVKFDGSLANGFIDYSAGVYYIREDAKTDYADIYTVSSSTVLLLADRILRNSTEAIAGYAQADFNVTPALKLTAGLRYTDETKKISFTDLRDACIAQNTPNCLNTQNMIAANGVPIPTKLNSKVWTPRFVVNYDVNDDVHLYVSATRGFKSGGWAARVSNPAAALPFGPEKVWNYEMGAKTQFLNNRVRANVTLFWMDVSDLQTPAGLVNPNGTITYITRNFADYRNRGVELELAFEPVRGLNLYVNGGYSNDKYIIDRNAPEFDEYGTQSVAAQQAACLALLAAGNVGGGPGTTSVCGAGIVTPSGDIAEPVRTPDWTVSMGGSYDLEIGDFTLVPTVNASYRSEMQVQSANTSYYSDPVSGTNGSFPINAYGNGDFLVGAFSKASWLLNAGLTLNGPNHAWAFSVTCSNCLDEEAIQTYLGYNYLNPPRTFLAKLRYNF
ncbi:TonB-dependent receptor [Sphingosinithalassobacter portus]|uniref:TonB-dependent receptor n=1 Tax=Stakelama portus TaxID=2676234 RepID=UPI000D6E6503|nr:TonB-dependent receptor [Sphingosinithalassobacter portus]